MTSISSQPPKVVNSDEELKKALEMSIQPVPDSTITIPTNKLAMQDIKVTEINDGVVVRRVIDADNECLFNAVGYCLEGRSRKKGSILRKIISDTVKNDPETYSEAFLGQSNIEYSKWLLLKDSWGGAIELSILSNYYSTEIATFDIQTEIMYVYGETKNYKQRIFLLYDGIHYDCLCLAPVEGAPEEIDITIFSANDQNIVNQSKQLVKKLRADRQFTDLEKFTLRCLVCSKGLQGEKEATKHAIDTSHQNFAEYK